MSVEVLQQNETKENTEFTSKKQKTAYNYHLLAKSRSISNLYQQISKHPLGVKPSANAFLADSKDLERIRESAGTLFNRLPDDIILQILSYLDVIDLVNASHVSKFWYAYATFDDLWRTIYTSKSEKKRKELDLTFENWKGSWRSSILSIPEQYEVNCNGLVYSDALFTPYINASIDYNSLFAEIIEEQEKLKDLDGYWDAHVLSNPSKYPYRGRIPRIDENTFNYEMFENHWSDHPFILGSNSPDSDRWPKWTISWLLEKFPDVKFRQESVLWELALYESYARKNNDENPLYLFDCRSEAMKSLLPTGYFDNPPLFAQNDLFKVFNECRPDHSWLITGPKRSGSTFHKDPNSTDAWNVVLEGSKLWVMLPPGMKPPGVFVSEDESEVMSPIGLAEWVKNGFWNDSITLSDDASIDTHDKNLGPGGFKTCIVGITFKNECMYVPSGWWHSVINLEDSVAFTANFVPPCKIVNVLNFMKFKPDQVSGFRHDLLQAKLNDFLNHDDFDNSDGNIKTIRDYLSREDLRNNDEDVGELKGTGCMPVFEAFVEFLRKSEYRNRVEKALPQLSNADMKNIKIKKSKIWNDLTKPINQDDGNKGSFSFGFHFDA
ncbi:hypothetical protein CANINC_002703 [Pichia inconspicua]|uniref:JmjC domain-containing protein n=1 Tax=Pichia inconspicua TaxID=52247 RepID=A0A4T0X0Y3_9ASCO|nr:hypothetical protein CANINC_002703 [[Candida] inconspicua]